MRAHFIAFSIVIFSSTAIAQKDIVYRWVDKNNVVHFSQNQPAHDNYTEIQVSTNATRKASNAAVENNDHEQAQTEKQTDALDLLPSTEKCEEAKANVQVLKTYDKIQYKNEDGETVLLSATQKEQQLAINEKQVEVYCGAQ